MHSKQCKSYHGGMQTKPNQIYSLLNETSVSVLFGASFFLQENTGAFRAKQHPSNTHEHFDFLRCFVVGGNKLDFALFYIW